VVREVVRDAVRFIDLEGERVMVREVVRFTVLVGVLEVVRDVVRFIDLEGERVVVREFL